MKLIVKFFSEIIIKSKPIRLNFIKILINNITIILKTFGVFFKIIKYWDRIEIFFGKNIDFYKINDFFSKIPGIHNVLMVEYHEFSDLSEISKLAVAYYFSSIRNKTFCVRVKRNGVHDFSSIEAERYIGFILNKHVKSSKVRLNNPDLLINIEIKDNTVNFVKNIIHGIGGFPIGTQGNVLSLISGGFDSSVSSYMLIRRGCVVHYCFFNIGGKNHLFNVKKIVYHIWSNFSKSHKVKFIVVDFFPVLIEIFQKIDNQEMNIVFKRMMIRIADSVSNLFNIPCLITGDSIGQVSTQTLNNIHLINIVTKKLILRPLISYDKQKIIEISRKIGTEYYCSKVPEFCNIFSKKQKINSDIEKIKEQEKKIDFSILKNVIDNIDVFNVSDLINNLKNKNLKIEVVNYINENEIILDIRVCKNKIKIPFVNEYFKVKSIPFFKLNKEFSKLRQDKTYLLYCDHGVMSYIQASILYENGFRNVKVYNP